MCGFYDLYVLIICTVFCVLLFYIVLFVCVPAAFHGAINDKKATY